MEKLHGISSNRFVFSFLTRFSAIFKEEERVIAYFWKWNDTLMGNTKPTGRPQELTSINMIIPKQEHTKDAAVLHSSP
jgi:hypothetical protein